MTSPRFATRSLRFSPLQVGRHFALAVALASGTALVGTLGFAAPAHAQKKNDKNASKPQYSKEFIDAYKALEAQINGGADLATIMPKLEEFIAMSASPDEKLQAGQMAYTAAVKAQDDKLQLRGLELMLASGKVGAEQLGQFNYIAFQLNYRLKNTPQARYYLQAAIDNKFTTEQLSDAIMKYQLAQLLMSEGKFDEGYAALKTAMAARKAEVGTIEQSWFGFGIKTGLDNELVPQTLDLLQLWLAEDARALIWRDSITITRNMALLDDRGNEEALLDLLRLAREVGTLERGQDYLAFVELARAARYPKEVKEMLDKGFASGAVNRGDTWANEQLAVANRTLVSDRTELPATEAAANKPGATLAQVMNAARTFLSYGDYAKAAGFFEKALAMPGAPQGEVLQRLGIAQVGMGDYDAAIATFAKVEEPARGPVAMLWSAYAKQKQAGVQIGG
ncbi:MAG: tetratricopeptide repeat protein [Erythrobacter sp.]